MTKHQSCVRCHSGFVGSDIDVGYNLCEGCDKEIYGEHNARIAELEAALEPFGETYKASKAADIPEWTLYDHLTIWIDATEDVGVKFWAFRKAAEVLGKGK